MDFGRESRNEKVAEELVLDHRTADLSPADRALCDWAVKLTIAPGSMTERDLAPLRAHGFSDEAITIAAQVVSYFNYINRIADGLGVDLEPWMKGRRDEWLRAKGRGY
jgi:uncharacterized peroxidase-related enzyme